MTIKTALNGVAVLEIRWTVQEWEGIEKSLKGLGLKKAFTHQGFGAGVDCDGILFSNRFNRFMAGKEACMLSVLRPEKRP